MPTGVQKHLARGFALPTILIASIVMLIVLLASVSSTAAVRNAILNQYYSQLALTAGEAGVEYAKACLNQNAGVPLWNDANPLRPNTNCSGVPAVACPTTAVDSRCAVTINDNVRSSFSIGLPGLDADGKAKTIPNTGYVEILRTSNNAVWRTYNQPSVQPAVVPDLCAGTATAALGWSNATVRTSSYGPPKAIPISTSTTNINPGPMYFRKDFSVVKGANYTFSIYANDIAEVYVDGGYLMTANRAISGANTLNAATNLSTGCHTIMIKLTNTEILQNSSVLVASLTKNGSSTPTIVTDSTWRVSAGPAKHYSEVGYYADPASWTPVRDINIASAINANWAGTSGDTNSRWINTTHSYDGSGNYPSGQFTLFRDNRSIFLSASTTVRISTLCDYACYPYVDGNPIGTNWYQGVVSFTLTLTEGYHKFAFLAYNDAGASGFAFAAVNTNDGTVLSRSDMSWSAASFWTATNPTNPYSYDNTYSPVPDSRPVAQCPCDNYKSAVLASSPLAYWPLNDTVGSTTAVDVSGNSLNGTYNGVITQGQTGALASSNNKSVLFGGTGTDTRISGASSAIWNRTNGQAFSVETWIKPNWSSGYRDIVVNRGTAGTYNWILYQHTTDGSIQLHGAAQNKSTYIPPNGLWTYIVATVDTSGVLRLYANGSLVQTVSGYTYGASPGSILHIGNGPVDVNEPYAGLIDETALYTKVLTPTEISAHYAARALP